jgi:hypothetical protein
MSARDPRRIAAAGGVGAIPGLVALAWMVYTKGGLSGRVAVTTSNALLPRGESGIAEWYVQVTATNIGRTPVMVTRWGISLPADRSPFDVNPLFDFDPPHFSTPLPVWLEAQNSASFYIAAATVRRTAQVFSYSFGSMRPYVVLISGKRVENRGIPLET